MVIVRFLVFVAGIILRTHSGALTAGGGVVQMAFPFRLCHESFLGIIGVTQATGPGCVNGARAVRAIRQTGCWPRSDAGRRRNHGNVNLSTIHVDNSVGTAGSASHVPKKTKPFSDLPNY